MVQEGVLALCTGYIEHREVACLRRAFSRLSAVPRDGWKSGALFVCLWAPFLGSMRGFGCPIYAIHRLAERDYCGEKAASPLGLVANLFLGAALNSRRPPWRSSSFGRGDTTRFFFLLLLFLFCCSQSRSSRYVASSEFTASTAGDIPLL